MTSKAKEEEMKAIFDPLIAKHVSPEELKAHQSRAYDQDAVTKEWDALIAEAKALMAKGDPFSPAALDLAGRWKAQVEKFTLGNPKAEAQARAVWNDAMADPKAAPKLPLNPEIFAFMGKAMGKLKEKQGG